jgi:hypothetical protein
MRKELRWAVRASTSPAPTVPGYDYGYWWWLEPGGAYVARGNLGQFVFAEVADSVASDRVGTTP